MKARRRLTMLALTAVWMLSPVMARGQEADILKAVPENAWGALIIRNLGEFDQKLMGTLQQLNVPPMSVLSLAKGSLGLSGGINDGGSAAVLFMPGAAVMAEPQKSLALLVPTQDYAALTSSLAPQDAGDGISKVTIAADESYIAQYGAYTVAGPAIDSVKAVTAAANGPGIAKAWSPHQRERFGQDDITLVLNLKSVFADPAISGMIVGLAAMSGQQVAPEQLQEWEIISIGLRLEKDGVRLGSYVGFKEGSDTAKVWATGVTTSKTLLTGLPGERYLAVAGMVQDAAGAKAVADQMDKDFEKTKQTLPPGVDQEKMAGMVKEMTAMYRDLRDLAISFSALPEGGDGLLGFANVATFEKGAVEKCDKFAEILQSLGTAVPVPQVQQFLQLVKYSAGAEQVGGVNVGHLTIAIDQAEGMTPEKHSKMKKVIGAEGLLIRIAAIDDKHVAATLGGGTARLQKVIELIKGNSAPLSADEGIKKVAAMLPNNRYLEGYVALDSILNFVKAVGKAIEEDPEIPFTVPKVDAPLAVVMAPAGTSGLQTDIAIPMPLIAAAKDVAISQASAPPPAGEAPQGGTPE